LVLTSSTITLLFEDEALINNVRKSYINRRNFEPMQRQLESWRRTEITDAEAKPILYSAFVDGKF
jgi:hypothetical protein